MAVQLKKRWNRFADGLVEYAREQESPQAALQFLGKYIRTYRTLRDRSSAIEKKLTKQAVKTMEALHLDEYQVSQRSFMLLKRVYRLPAGETGQQIYDHLVETYGQAFVAGIYTKEEVKVPATTTTVFTLNEKALNKLDKELKRELGRKINLTVSLDVGEVPQRVKENKERRKR